MTTALRLAVFTLAMAASTLITHHLWGASGAAAPLDAPAAAATPPPWALVGFRDEERCTMLSAPPECD